MRAFWLGKGGSIVALGWDGWVWLWKCCLTEESRLLHLEGTGWLMELRSFVLFFAYREVLLSRCIILLWLWLTSRCVKFGIDCQEGW